MPEHKTFNYQSVILDEMTLQNEGYLPSKYGISSLKFVWATCRFCGQPARLRKAFFKRAGSACHGKCRLEEQSKFSPFKNVEVRTKARQTIRDRFGAEYASQNPEVAKKIAQSKRSMPSAFHDVRNALIDSGVHFNTKHNLIIIPEHQFIVATHFNDDLVDNRSAFQTTKKYNGQGFHVFHIFEHQWPARQKQLMNFINTCLSLSNRKIAARSCVLDHSEQNGFIEDNHIQGKAKLVLKYFNLVYDNNDGHFNEVVGSMTASKHHRQNTDKEAVVLSRLCFKHGVNLQGGSTKLFKRFVEWAKESGFKQVISWSDNTWAKGGIYKVLGFELAQTYPPDYFYWHAEGKKVYSKQSQQKKKTGCPPGLTEREWCIERELYRIWDCGKKKWVYNL